MASRSVFDVRKSTHEVSLLNIETWSSLAEALNAVMNSELVAFVIRQTGVSGNAVSNNLMLRDTIREGLGSLGYKASNGQVVPGFVSSTEVGPGNLHIDKRRRNKFDEIDVHTTTAGAGKVLMAESGSHAGLRGNQRLSKREMHRAILQGMTDPDIISPTIHMADLNEGDSIIFPPANGHGPVWHRFDTTVAPRRADISRLKVKI